MLIKILSYVFLAIYTLIYTLNNYSSILSIIINSIILLLIFGLINYHYDLDFKNKKRIIISLILAVLVTILTFGQLGYSYRNKTIEIKNIYSFPVTINAIYKNDVKQKIDKEYISKYDRFNQSSVKTEYQLYNKIDDSYKATLQPNEKYQIKVDKIKKIKIYLQKERENYDILINNKKYKINKFDQELTDKAYKIYDSSFKINIDNIDRKVPLYKTIIISIVSIFVYFNLIMRILNYKKGILLLLPVLLIEINPYINLNLLTKIIFSGIYLLFILKFDQEWKYKNIKQKILIIISSIYISFSFVGNNLLLEKVNFKTLCIFTLFCIWIYNLVPFVLNFINKLKKKNKKEEKNNNIFVHKLLVFVITVVIVLIYHLVFYPYIVSPDGYMQLQDIINNTLSNWHPYLHTLILKTFYMIFGSVDYFILFRIFIYAAILTNILFYFYKKGLSLTKIYLIAILFTILPVTSIFLVTMWKDTDFQLALLYLTFLIYLIIKDFDYFNQNKLNYLWLIISLLCVGLFRHNGIIVMFLTVIFLFIYSLKKHQKLLLLSLIFSFILALLVKGPIYNKLKVQDKPANFEIATILHGFNRLIYNDNKINNDAYEYLVDQIPLEIWKVSYDEYNIDLLLHYQTINIRDKKLDKNKLIKYYFKQFFISPIELIKDRLYGTDIIWNVSEKDDVMTSKYIIMYDEFETSYAEELGIKYSDNIISNIIKKSLLFLSTNEVLNSLFFRGGIYIDILILIFIYCFFKDKKSLFICLIPFIINLLTLFLAMHHYEYRYIWNVELITLLFILIFLFDNQKEKTN